MICFQTENVKKRRKTEKTSKKMKTLEKKKSAAVKTKSDLVTLIRNQGKEVAKIKRKNRYIFWLLLLTLVPGFPLVFDFTY